jgi:hypothetical protein
MNIEFVGEPRRPANGAAVFRIDASADGHHFVCTITEEAIRAAAGAAAPQTPTEMVATFRRHEQRFRDVAAVMLADRNPLPADLKIRDADLRREPPTA